MTDAERQFPEFALAVVKGLYRAAITDVDIFLMFAAAILLGSPRRRERAFGRVVVFYITCRRADQYTGVVVRKTDQFARLMAERTQVT